MWFMNKIANPLVRLILRSPLHWILGPTVLLVTYRGRKSGKEYSLPVQYAQDDHTIYIVPGAPEKKTWWRNLRGGAPVKLFLAGKAIYGKAAFLQGETDVALIVHGLDIYFKRFPPSARMRNLHPMKNGSLNQDELHQLAQCTVMVRVVLD